MKAFIFREAGVNEKKRTRALSLNAFLTRLICLSVLPLLILTVYLAFNHIYSMQDQYDRTAAYQARNLVAAIDHRLEAHIAGLQVLADSPLLDDPPRLREFYDGAKGFREAFGGHIILADLSKRMILNTRAPYGAALPSLPEPKGHAAAPVALATGKPAVGDMLFGPVSKESLIAVAVPVVQNGQTKFLLLSTTESRQFQHLVDELAFPAGWSVTLLDGKDEAIAHRLQPGENLPSGDGEPTMRYVAKSTLAHWSVVLEIPGSVYRAPIIASALSLVWAILLVTLASFLGGRWASRRLARSVAALAGMPSQNTPGLEIEEIESARKLLDESTVARDAAELKRQESDQNLRQALQAAKAGNWEYDLETGEGFWSEEMWKLYGVEKQDCEPGVAIWLQTIHPEDREKIERWIIQAKQAASELNLEWRVRTPDGLEKWHLTRGRPVCDEAGKPVRYIGIAMDITERKHAELELNESLQEKVALLKEVHHRVKNNLQIVASLLNLQAGRISSREAVEVLIDTRNRVRSMALLHEVLYRSGNLAHINFAAYTRELLTHLMRSSGPVSARVNVENRVAPLGFPLEQALPCGLIINELFSNALKHGFPEERRGSVVVTLQPDDGQQITLSVEDDGVGVPPGFDPENTATLGLKLVFNLAAQLGGKFAFECPQHGGAVFRVVFPLPPNNTL